MRQYRIDIAVEQQAVGGGRCTPIQILLKFNKYIDTHMHKYDNVKIKYFILPVDRFIPHHSKLEV